jgi:hypothetical protein
MNQFFDFMPTLSASCRKWSVECVEKIKFIKR